MASAASGDRIGVFNIAPALLTSRVTSEHCLTAALMSLVELTSSCIGTTRESVIFDGSRAHAYTFAAREDKSASTYALPKPRFAPVTSATLPEMFMDPPDHWMIARLFWYRRASFCDVGWPPIRTFRRQTSVLPVAGSPFSECIGLLSPRSSLEVMQHNGVSLFAIGKWLCRWIPRGLFY